MIMDANFEEVLAKRISELESDLRAAHESLYLVLEAVVEPVYVDAKRVREGIIGDKMISAELDEKAGEWVFSVKDVEDEQ